MHKPASRAAPDEAVLLREDRDGLARLTLNHARARNPLSEAMLEALAAALTTIGGDRSCVAVLSANGPGVFPSTI